MHVIRKSLRMIVLVLVIVFVCKARICFSAEGIEGKVNINTATETQLALLPGIGPKLATEIVNYRGSNGNFKTIEDIKKINGVGNKKFEKIKDLLVVEGDTTIRSTKMAEGEKEGKQERKK